MIVRDNFLITSYRTRRLTFPAIIKASDPYYANCNELLYAEFFFVMDGKRAHTESLGSQFRPIPRPLRRFIKYSYIFPAECRRFWSTDLYPDVKWWPIVVTDICSIEIWKLGSTGTRKDAFLFNRGSRKRRWRW